MPVPRQVEEKAAAIEEAVKREILASRPFFQRVLDRLAELVVWR